MNYSLFRLAIIPLLALSVASPCLADDFIWNAGTDNWFTPGNWTPPGPPTAAPGDEAIINNGGTAQIAAAGAAANIIELGFGVGDSGTISITGAGTLNNPNVIDIGFSGTGTVNITTGGQVTARTTRIATNLGSTGLLSVDGGGSSWSAPLDIVAVGEGGNGTLSVTNGGEVTSFSGAIGDAPAAVGTATINGAGSNWTLGGPLYVAFLGHGTLNIQNGGDVTNAQGNIGGASFTSGTIGAVGVANVDGAGSTWTNIDLTVGFSAGAMGTLNITNGGAVFSQLAFIANHEGSTGVVNVNGTGSTWTNSPTGIVVGFSGNGTLNILNGGVVTNAGNAQVASQETALGVANISGTGSTWSNGGNLGIGDAGNGTMNITAGGTVSNNDGSIGYGGFGTGAIGAVTVSGSGSTWTNTGTLVVGVYDTGTLNITNSGTVTANGSFARIGEQATSTGTVTVDGAGSTWTLANELDIARAGTGTLTVQNGGVVNMTGGGRASIGVLDGSNGTATVDGAGSAWTNSGGLIVGESGSGQLHITNGGAVSNTFGSLGANAGSTGTATIDGTGSTWTNNGTLSVGSLGTGSMTITNGGVVHTNQSLIGSSSTGNGTAIVDGTGSTWTTSSLYVGGDSSGPMGTGLLRILNGGIVTSGAATVWSSGTLEIGINPNLVATLTFDGGTLRTIANTTFTNNATLTGMGTGVVVDSNGFDSTLSGVFSGTGGLEKIGAGSITLTNVSSYTGSTLVNEGTLFVDGSISSITYVNGGTLGGTGTIISNVYNNTGVVSPGHPGAGTLTVFATYTQNPFGTLLTEIGGTAPGQFDLLQASGIGGHAFIDGTLQLVRINNYNPMVGDQVVILDTNTGVTGTFDSVVDNFLTLIRPSVVYDPDAVRIVFVQGSFQIGGLTPNQQAVAENLDNAVGDPAADPVIDFLNTELLGALPHDYDLIAPEEIASIYEINFSGATVQWLNMQHRMDDIRAGSTGFSSAGYQMRDQHGLTVALQDKVVLDAKGPKQSVMTPACDNRWGVFVTGTGEHVTVGEDDFNAHGFDFTTGLVTVGVDYRLTNHFVIGATGTFLHSNADLIDNGDVDATGGKMGLFATYFAGGFYVDLAADGGWNNYDTQRTALGGIATGDTDGAAFNALMAAGYDWKFGCFSIGPTAAFQFSYAGIDGFTETGSLAPLQYPDQDEDAERSALGLRAMCNWKVREHIVIRPEIRAAWKHEFGDNAYPIDSAFASGAGGIFTVHGPKVWRDSALVSSGINVHWSNCISTSVYYDGEISRANYDNHSLTGAVRIGF